MSASVAIENEGPLQFADSKSKAVGLTGSLMDTLRDNAPRVVGVLKSIGDVAGGMVGHPMMITFAAFSLVGRSFMILWGSKKHQATLAEEASQEKIIPLGNSWSDSLQKVMHPRQYPMEAAAGMSLVGESFGAAYGAAELLQGDPGWTPLLLGVLAVWSYSNILFKKEGQKTDEKEGQQEDPLVFQNSESKTVGIIGAFKDMVKNNPVLLSSVTNIAICLTAFALSCIEGMQPQYLIYLGIGVGANLVQALLVRKNDYNIEGIQKESQQVEKDKTANAIAGRFSENIVQQSSSKELPSQGNSI